MENSHGLDAWENEGGSTHVLHSDKIRGRRLQRIDDAIGAADLHGQRITIPNGIGTNAAFSLGYDARLWQNLDVVGQQSILERDIERELEEKYPGRTFSMYRTSELDVGQMVIIRVSLYE